MSLGESTLAGTVYQLQQENERLNAHCAQLSKEHHEALDENERLKEGLARIKELSDGRSVAWTLAYEALNNLPYSYSPQSGDP